MLPIWMLQESSTASKASFPENETSPSSPKHQATVGMQSV